MSQPLSQQLFLQPRLPKSFFNSWPSPILQLLLHPLSHPLSQPMSQPQEGASQPQVGASQPQLGASQQLSQPPQDFLQENSFFSSPPPQLFLLPHPLSQPMSQPHGSSQPQLGASQPHAGASQPQVGSSQPHAGASQPQTTSWFAAIAAELAEQSAALLASTSTVATASGCFATTSWF